MTATTPSTFASSARSSARCATLLRPGGRLVVNVGNVLSRDGTVTPLASDIAGVIDEHVPLLGVTTLVRDEPPAGLDGDYLLWFATDESDGEHRSDGP